MKILITGDLMVDHNYNPCLIKESNVVNLFSQSDINLVNLEAPITNSNEAIEKTGPVLRGDEKNTSKVLDALNIDITTLANNHILDYGEKGLRDTLDFLKKNQIKTVGAGMNLEEASKTLYVNSEEGKIAFVCFAENEWANATIRTPGANPMNFIDNLYQIQNARKNADFVFVIVHGGHEYYNLPSPRMQKQYRFYTEQGADIVVGHHTHCVNGNEIYRGTPIYYSLGNFIFTKPNFRDDWYSGLILEVNINNSKLTCNVHPVKQAKSDYKLSLASGSEKAKILDKIQNFNEIILDKEKLSQEWSTLVNSKYHQYINRWFILRLFKHKCFGTLFRKTRLTKLFRKIIALILNLIRCEAHVDISRSLLVKYLDK